MTSSPRVFVIVPAAGRGLRFGSPQPKQYLPLAGVPVLAHTLRRLDDLGARAIAVGLAAEDPYWPELRLSLTTPLLTFTGGAERALTVLNGLATLTDQAAEDDLVFVHDAARPCVRGSDLRRLYEAALDAPDGALLARPVADTVKRGGAEGITATIDRRDLWLAQTPQVFRFGRLQAALASAVAAQALVTDEASAIERMGGRPRLVAGHQDNIKITTPEDLVLAEIYLAWQKSQQEGR
ncbi:2-C-methyl-D-erythritol 4-phosphate cytidylyltransferase [Acidiferrobacter thiooxydans]|uniref:2-C-methyl-D-erythritol 4-phosphate cytidylyltransferase n=1 Tax=Acidiferrobacter thiooxydans TaxID=163359 RepID=UPI0008253706|nr:2-C-methyl-D-erythritol 4-phosphate cytidylyltransferase [Acidiferrobacter thiooxydans]MDA8192143.1 2-C-methyl-D-erythritol 4-phosphate cytidylyltransferase [Gammaproteobacteria bacterium]UEO00747.1 2-C-methyl-D-erythritol 4-phosphate cytidylyltransferase [Acidiferrobacter thiooxydans]